MRWPIRNQILLPFVATGVLTVGAIAVTTSWIAVRNVEAGIRTQLAHVVAALEGASFPLTPNVLTQLRALSGAHFVLLDSSRRRVATTLGDLPQGDNLVSDDQWLRLDHTVVGEEGPFDIAGVNYFAGRVRWVDSRGGGHVLVLYPHADWRAARWQAMSPPLLIGGALLLVTVTASIVLSRRFGRRIQRMQTQVARIAAGNFQPIAASPIDDELRDLSLAVNRMATALAESMQRIRETERSTLLTQLVGGLAHQLRNAITGARISVQLHQRRCAAADDDALDVALKQLRLTEEQIKALLRVTRGETRSPVSGDVSEILQQTVALVRPICEHHRITLESDDAAADWAIDDADAMRAALLNLMMNAVEAAGPRGLIRVRTNVERHGLRITIADNGRGFPENVDIFQSFFTTKPEGVGLGLSLARQAVDDCGGTLTAHRDDGMTVFEIALVRHGKEDHLLLLDSIDTASAQELSIGSR
ncbi:MAG: HAMP domain-containing histidine kinase [Planctomycetaceae bacterium]|nr:HAMP domain-containing histidine kinase [Planctomycetaceae bacterium]